MKKQRITQLGLHPGFIDLGSGNPGLDLFPLEMLQRAGETYFQTIDPHTLQYGAEEGNGYFLAALADFLTTETQSTVNPGSLFTTTGASSALDLFCTLQTRAGDVIFVEEPSYFLALRIFADHGLQVIPLAMDKEGLKLDQVLEMLTKYRPKCLYTIPTFHNPASITLSQSRREQLIHLAQEQDFLILADEVYQFLAYTQDPPQPFAAYTSEVEQVVSINSFSKILAPGLRLGWIQAHEKIIKQLVGCGLLDSGGGMNPFTSAIIRYLIESGDLQKNITALQKIYLARIKALTIALNQHLPQAEYTLPQGGFFVWVRLPGIDTATLRHKAQQFQVDYRPGTLFSSQNGLREYMRLAFCHYSPEDIETGIIRLGKCLED